MRARRRVLSVIALAEVQVSIFVQTKTVMPQTASPLDRIDPLLALGVRHHELGAAPASPLQRLQRRLGLGFDTKLRELGLPPEMAGLIPEDASPRATVTSLLTASKIFDAAFYLAQSPAGAGAQDDPLSHFATKGWQQGLSPNFYFEPAFYASQAGAVDSTSLNPLLHYLYAGESSGLRPSQHFDPVWYRTHYGLVGQSALCHFLRHIEERRFSPNPDFDVEYYLRIYPDVRRNGGDPLRHYILCGQREGRQPRAPGAMSAHVLSPAVARIEPPAHETKPSNAEAATETRDADVAEPSIAEIAAAPAASAMPAEPVAAKAPAESCLDDEVRTLLDSNLFDVAWYRRRADQATAEPIDLARHYLASATGIRVSPNPLFDIDFYLQRYGDVVLGSDPFLHYVRDGWRRNFDPHPLFSVRYYLDENSDVREGGHEPLGHYVTAGCREGRSPCEEFDARHYLAENSDVAAQGLDPLLHYIEYGAAEGRNPSSTFDTSWYARHLLKGKTDNPLVHFRLSGLSAEDVFVRKISLSKTFEMSDQDFRRWTRTFYRDDEPKSSAEGITLVRVTCTHAEAAVPSDGDQSLDGALAACRSASDLQSHNVYLFCDQADEIDARLVPRLTARIAETNGLGIFDFASRRGDFWTPILLPGANAAYLEAIDATFSRFAMSGRLLAELELPRNACAYDVLRAALRHLRGRARLDLFTHTPAPILRTQDLSDGLRAKQLDLAQRVHTANRPRSVRGAPSSVSIVICTKDRCRLLAQLVDCLLHLDAALVREIVIVANPAEDSLAHRVHAHYATKKRVSVLRHEGAYNFSQQSNRGAARCSGDLLLFLNDDIVPITSHWLEALRAPFADAKVGISGPLLLYPDERSQHAGMYLGFNDCAGHTMRGARLPEDEYMFMASAPRNVSAVTGAAMLTTRALFEDMNGFDRQLGTYLQDLDFCLRVRNSDRDIIYEPRSLLFHMESVSMRETPEGSVFADRRPLEHQRFMRKWGASLAIDEFHNPNFDIGDESLRTIARIT